MYIYIRQNLWDVHSKLVDPLDKISEEIADNWWTSPRETDVLIVLSNLIRWNKYGIKIFKSFKYTEQRVVVLDVIQ